MTAHSVYVVFAVIRFVQCVILDQSSSPDWGTPTHGKSAPTKPEKSAHVNPNANYTVLINTFHRPQCLFERILHWRECGPREIRIVWSEGEQNIPGWLRGMERQGMVVLDIYPTTGLTNRFHPQPFAGSAVFSIDDDIQYSCKIMEGAFNVFRSHPQQAVGFSPRLLSENGYVAHETYDQNRANALFITKGGFLPASLFDTYYTKAFEPLRIEADKQRTGEDMIMSFVYAQVVGLPVVPLLVKRGEVSQPTCSRALSSISGGASRLGMIKLLYQQFGDALTTCESTSFVDPLSGKDERYNDAEYEMV